MPLNYKHRNANSEGKKKKRLGKKKKKKNSRENNAWQAKLVSDITGNNLQDNYPWDNYPPGQQPTRTTTPIGPLPLWDNYPPRAITHIARTTTPKDNYPHRKVIGHISTTLPSLTGNRGEYFRVVGTLEMVDLLICPDTYPKQVLCTTEVRQSQLVLAQRHPHLAAPLPRLHHVRLHVDGCAEVSLALHHIRSKTLKLKKYWT